MPLTLVRSAAYHTDQFRVQNCKCASSTGNGAVPQVVHRKPGNPDSATNDDEQLIRGSLHACVRQTKRSPIKMRSHCGIGSLPGSSTLAVGRFAPPSPGKQEPPGKYSAGARRSAGVSRRDMLAATTAAAALSVCPGARDVRQRRCTIVAAIMSCHHEYSADFGPSLCHTQLHLPPQRASTILPRCNTASRWSFPNIEAKHSSSSTSRPPDLCRSFFLSISFLQDAD